MTRTTTASAALAAVLALTLAGCASDEGAEAAASSPPASAVAEPTESAPESDEATEAATPDEAEEAVATEGSWIDRKSYEADPATYHDAGDVVLFFSASWCPPCRATVENLDADGTPAGLTVVRVDYDNSSELKKEYGVTYQHTFVQVDESGAQLTKFTGSRSGDEIASNTV